MQRLLAIVTCLCGVGAVAYVHMPGPEELSAIAPWGVGVVLGSLMLAVVAGEAVRFVKLPRVVGYVLVGMVAVPLNRGILRPAGMPAETDPTQFFETWQVIFAAAVVLTGLAIGLRIDVAMLRAHGRAVLAHSCFQIVLATGSIGALAWWLAEPFGVVSPSLLGCGVLGLLAATSSATALYAVNSDLRAEGTLPELQILVAVVKDTLIVGLLIALVFGLGPDLGPSIEHVRRFAQGAWFDVGAAVGFGVAGGLVVLGMLRWAQDQVVIVSVSMAVAAAIIVPHSLAALFVGGLIAGGVAGNTAGGGFQLTDSLDRSSPFWLSVVFVFTLAGTQLPISFSLWMLGVVLMAVRGVVFYLASRLATTVSSRVGGRHFAYSLLAQSLVALFAVRFIAGGQHEHLLGLDRMLVPLVVLDLLVGTVLHRLALIRSGTVTRASEEEETEATVHSFEPRGEDVDTDLDDDRSLLPAPTFPGPTFRSAKLNRIANRLRQRLIRAQDQIAHQFFDPRRDFVDHFLQDVRERLQQHVYETFEELRDVGDPIRRKQIVRQRRTELDEELHDLIVTFGPTHEPGDLDESLREFLLEVERACNVDAQVRAPEEEVTREREPSDDLYTRFRKALHTVDTRFGPRPMRTVPVRALALHHLAHGLPDPLGVPVHLDGRFRVYVWQRVTNAFRDVEELHQRTLDHLDPEVEAEASDVGAVLADVDEQAARRESEELAAFDERLRELARVRDELSEPSGPAVTPLLAAEESEESGDPVLTAWSALMEEMPTHFDDLERDVFDFEADVRRRLALTTDTAYRELLRDLGKAGTFALPARRIDPAPRQGSAERRADELSDEIEHWQTLALAFVDRRNMRLGFRQIEARLRPLLDSFIADVETELCSHLTYYPAEISERCDDVVESLDESFRAGASDSDLSDAFVQIRKNLSDFLQDDALASVQEVREANVFGGLIRKFAAHLTDIVHDQRPLYVVVDESFLDRPEALSASDVEPSNVPFHDLVDKHLVQTTVASFNELAMRVRDVVDTVATGLGEVNRVISFNLDAATSELRADDETANRDLVAEFAVGGIRRAGEHASALLEQVQDEIDDIDRDILARTVEHSRSVRRYLFDESMGRLERLVFELETDRSTLQRQGFELLASLRESALGTLHAAARPARVAVDIARERLSLEEAGRDELLQDVGAATFEWQRLTALPLAYRRLFTPTPVDIAELFVAQDEAMERANNAIERWESGRRTSIVITGDLGVGKTSFLHRLLAERLSGANMLRWNVRGRITTERELAAELANQFGIHRTTSVERLLAALPDLEKARVVVLDGLERLFLRTMGGSEALTAFFSLVSQSPPSLLWLTTCNASLWSYLATMHGAETFFSDHLALHPFDVEQTEALILQRHRVSGYGLHYLVDEAESLTPKRFIAGQQQRLHSRFFKRLHEVTGGHPLLSLYYWLASIETAESDELMVHPMRPLRTDHLRRLDDDQLIALGQLVMHEELSEDGFAAVMRTSKPLARRDLALFESLNLVVQQPGQRHQYRINEVLYHDLEQALGDRNIV